jgi:hypothetical protein
MSKKTVLKGGRADVIMANMSANILRELVSRVFEVRATEVKLSGELNPEFDLNGGTSYSSSCGHSVNSNTVYAFNPESGFKEIAGDDSHWSDGSGGRHEAAPYPLHEHPDVSGDELFFVIKNIYNSGSWDGDRDAVTWTLYKAPDFRAKRDLVEAIDVARWEAWLEE